VRAVAGGAPSRVSSPMEGPWWEVVRGAPGRTGMARVMGTTEACGAGGGRQRPAQPRAHRAVEATPSRAASARAAAGLEIAAAAALAGPAGLVTVAAVAAGRGCASGSAAVAGAVAA
jgi:hypothetical protein